jgi:hypothetical protein
MKKNKTKAKKETAGGTFEQDRPLILQVSSAIKALNLPAGSDLVFRRCGCGQQGLFVDQRKQKLSRGFVRRLTALAGKFGLNFSTQLVCPECDAPVGGDMRLEITHAGSKTVERNIPLAISNPNASQN